MQVARQRTQKLLVVRWTGVDPTQRLVQLEHLAVLIRNLISSFKPKTFRTQLKIYNGVNYQREEIGQQ